MPPFNVEWLMTLKLLELRKEKLKEKRKAAFYSLQGCQQEGHDGFALSSSREVTKSCKSESYGQAAFGSDPRKSL